MKKTTKKIIALPLLALAFLPALTNAANVDLNMNVGINGPERGRPEGRPGIRPDRNMPRMGTTTKDWNRGTTTRSIAGKNIGGLITVIGASSFSLESPSRNGTTTTSVIVDSNTAFRSGTSTVTLANLSVGQRVSVIGDYATSTNTLTAKQVMVINPKGMDNREKHKEKGFKDKVFGWFKKMF